MASSLGAVELGALTEACWDGYSARSSQLLTADLAFSGVCCSMCQSVLFMCSLRVLPAPRPRRLRRRSRASTQRSD